MTLLASDVALPPDLLSSLSGFGSNAYNAINNNYNAASQKQAQDQSVKGYASPGGNSYGAERLAATKGLDIGNLEAGLGGGLGNTAYTNAIQQRNFGQQKQIADLIGGAMAPTTLQQIFAGIGGGAGAGMSLLPFLGMMGGGGGGGYSNPSVGGTLGNPYFSEGGY